MKTQFLLSLAMTITIISVYGQRPTMTLTFTANENGQHVPLNSILIENLTRQVDTTLYAPDTMLVLDYLTGINENQTISGDGLNVAQNYPNPIEGKTTIEFFIPEADNVLIIVGDMIGRKLVNRNHRLNRGNHTFTFYPGTESLYFLTVRTNRHSQTIKMINTPTQVSSQANCALEYNGAKAGFDSYKSGNDRAGFVFYLGDLLKFTAYTDVGGRVISSSPTGDQTYHFSFTGQPCTDTPTVSDIDGNVYNTVQIGDQCWMKENLKTTRDASGSSITRYCYHYNSDYCAWYGGLYTWNTLMNGAGGSNNNPSGVQGICPTDWHVPSDAEWTQLVDYLDGQGYPNHSTDPNGAANALKSCRQEESPIGGNCNTNEHPRWDSHSTHHGFDEFGFAAFPGGYLLTDGTFNFLGRYGYWWSASEELSTFAWYRIINHINGLVDRYYSSKAYGFSVRCVRDY
jgi:uncharacterized protein (TIGR02145 family)